MELTINSTKIQEILHWVQENVDEYVCLDCFGIEPADLTEMDIIDYLVAVIESNLEYDFNFRYGVE